MKKPRWPRITLIVVALVVAGITIARLFVESFTVGGTHMSPTYEDGDGIWVDRQAYDGVADVRRGDVVAADRATASGRPYFMVGRVVGLPGDRVEILPEQIVLNGSPLGREPVRASSDGARYFNEVNDGAAYVVRYPVGGADSHNSGDFAVPLGELLVVGDNRAVPSVAVLPFDAIRGKVTGKVIDR